MIELNFFGKDARFHHIGLVVKSIKDINPLAEIITDSIQRVRVAFVLLNGIKLELIEPYGDNSPVIESLKRKVKFLHMCYTVHDIEEVIKECRKYGFTCIAEPVPAAAFDNKIAWVYSNEYGLFELLEEGKTTL